MSKYMSTRAIINIKHKQVDNDEYRRLLRLVVKLKKQIKLTNKEIYRKKLKTTRKQLQNIKTKYTDIIINIKLNHPKFQNFQTSFEYGHKDMVSAKDLKECILSTIRSFRLNEVSKDQIRAEYWFNNHMFFIGKKGNGRVFKKENQVYNAYLKKNIATVYDVKKPSNLVRHIGIELEFCAPISEKELALKLFKAGLHKMVQLKKDGSLRPQGKEEAFELAILLKQESYKFIFKKITNILKEVGAIAENRRCGLHIHLDMRKRNKELAYSNLIACQGLLLSLVDPKRRNNEFCTTVKTRKFPKKFNGSREERYKTINAVSFYKFGTLEVRMHEGSVDYKQITNWVDLLVKIVNVKKKIKRSVLKLTSLKRYVNVNKHLDSYLSDRVCYWQVNKDNGYMTATQILGLYNTAQFGIVRAPQILMDDTAATRNEEL